MKILIRLPRRLATWGAAHAAARLEEYAFDYIFYPYMLYSGGASILRLAGVSAPESSTGYRTGLVILVSVSAVLNVVYVLAYDRSRRDLFGFEHMRQTKLAARTESVPFLRWPLRIGAFCYLSIWHSPLFATLWLRSREQQFAMSRDDWVILGLAILTANIGWATAVTLAVGVGRIVAMSAGIVVVGT